MTIPRVHAALRHAHADGADIEAKTPNGGDGWQYDPCPTWNPLMQYRVKPEREYPVTAMTDFELCYAVSPSSQNFDMGEQYRSAANAAIRRAIVAQQVVPMAEVQEVARELAKKRELAVARAVDAAYCVLVPFKQRNSDNYLESIIASIKD